MDEAFQWLSLSEPRKVGREGERGGQKRRGEGITLTSAATLTTSPYMLHASVCGCVDHKQAGDRIKARATTPIPIPIPITPPTCLISELWPLPGARRLSSAAEAPAVGEGHRKILASVGAHWHLLALPCLGPPILLCFAFLCFAFAFAFAFLLTPLQFKYKYKYPSIIAIRLAFSSLALPLFFSFFNVSKVFPHFYT